MLFKKKISLDYLRNKPHIKLYQANNSFKMNTDSCLLGEFYDNFEENANVLDIGTNNGVLLLYAALKPYKKLYGIDINKKGLKLAYKNLKMNKVRKFKLFHYDFLKYKFDIKFQRILINPPYFNNSSKNKNTNIKYARHDDTLPLDKLIEKCSQTLDKNGFIYMVNRYENFEKIKNYLDAYNLILTDYKLITAKQSIKTILLKITNKI